MRTLDQIIDSLPVDKRASVIARGNELILDVRGKAMNENTRDLLEQAIKACDAGDEIKLKALLYLINLSLTPTQEPNNAVASGQ